MTGRQALRPVIWAAAVCTLLGGVGCGYSRGTLLPPHLRTIAIPTFSNKTFEPRLEVDVTNAVIRRFLQDGQVKVVSERDAGGKLVGVVVRYDREALRLTTLDGVEEQRIVVVVDLQYHDRTQGLVLWEERGFVGESTYFTSGPLLKTEAQARTLAVDNLARRVVDRTVEAW